MDLILERAILARLRVGAEEPYELDADALQSLGRVLARVMRGNNAMAEVHRALQLITAFERELESPSVADALVELLRSDPDARELVRTRVLRTGAIDETRSFRSREGRQEPVRAPSVAGRRPTSAVPLASLARVASGVGVPAAMRSRR